jgi:hypothetical protein
LQSIAELKIYPKFEIDLCFNLILLTINLIIVLSAAINLEMYAHEANYGDHTPVTVTRTIQPNLYLRPIPDAQIQGMEMTADEKAAYQTPGY